jgi:hypothetical protein
MSDEREHLKLVTDDPLSIKKPGEFKLDMFKSTRDPSIANVETLITALPHFKISEAKDWARLHPDEATYWSDELCFVNVPIIGQKRDTLHLITEKLAERYLPSNRIQRFRLTLATKPHDVFFLCHVPSRNMDNAWNDTNYLACLQAKMSWVQATSRKGENVEGYQISCLPCAQLAEAVARRTDRRDFYRLRDRSRRARRFGAVDWRQAVARLRP